MLGLYTDLENPRSIIKHAVERLDSFLPKVDSCGSPMYIAMIDRNKDRILAENVYLEKYWSPALRPKE
jgi:hypothetical protein